MLRRKLRAASYTSGGQDLAALFARYDKDRNGTLSVSELHSVVNRLLPGQLRQADVWKLLSFLDRDDRGHVSLPDFVTFIRAGGGSLQERRARKALVHSRVQSNVHVSHQARAAGGARRHIVRHAVARSQVASRSSSPARSPTRSNGSPDVGVAAVSAWEALHRLHCATTMSTDVDADGDVPAEIGSKARAPTFAWVDTLRLFDSDRDGILSAAELRGAIATVDAGSTFGAAESDAMVKALGGNESNRIVIADMERVLSVSSQMLQMERAANAASSAAGHTLQSSDTRHNQTGPRLSSSRLGGGARRVPRTPGFGGSSDRFQSFGGIHRGAATSASASLASTTLDAHKAEPIVPAPVSRGGSPVRRSASASSSPGFGSTANRFRQFGGVHRSPSEPQVPTVSRERVVPPASNVNSRSHRGPGAGISDKTLERLLVLPTHKLVHASPADKYRKWLSSLCKA